MASGWAWGGDEFPDAAAEALAWLENQPAPLIVTRLSSGTVRRSPTTFVPRNLTPREMKTLAGHLRAGRDDDFRRDSGRVARIFPTRSVGDEPVWFVWRDARPDPDRAWALERLAGELQYLGSSRSPVLGTAIVGPSDEVPWSEGARPEESGQCVFEPVAGGDLQRTLRVAYPGLTATLLSGRGTSFSARLGASATYSLKPAGVMAEGEQQAGPFAALTIKRRAGFGLTVSHTTTLTEAFRLACLSIAGDAAPAVLHGHSGHPHVAYLALPNVGGKHSDGVVLGLGVAIPAATPAPERKAIRAALAGIEDLNIGGGALRWELKDVEPGNVPWALQAQRWTGPARRWSTATPVILDRHPSRDFSVKDGLRLSFRNALLPEPRHEDIEISPATMLSGTGTPSTHIRPPRLRGLPLHVTVTFPFEVVGPMLVGRGRYLGLGLFAPLAERDGKRTGGRST